MSYDIEQVRGRIASLGFPQVFLDILDNRIPLELSGNCSPPRVAFQKGFQQKVDCVPLWECNGEELVAYDPRKQIFLLFNLHTGSTETIAKSYQQLVTWLFIELIDSGVWDELDSLAAKFGYKHLQELKTFAETADDDDYTVNNRRFIDSIAD